MLMGWYLVVTSILYAAQLLMEMILRGCEFVLKGHDFLGTSGNQKWQRMEILGNDKLGLVTHTTQTVW